MRVDFDRSDMDMDMYGIDGLQKLKKYLFCMKIKCISLVSSVLMEVYMFARKTYACAKPAEIIIFRYA